MKSTTNLVFNLFKSFMMVASLVLAGHEDSSAQFVHLREVSHSLPESMLGGSVALNDDWVFIAAPNQSTDNMETVGSIYVYKYSSGNWEFKQTLNPYIDSPFLSFGSEIISFGSWLAVSKIGDHTTGPFSGSVSLYELSGDTWAYSQTLYIESESGNDAFGSGIDMNDEYLVIGAENHKLNEDRSGIVRVFHREGSVWTLTEQITAPEPEIFSDFGASVAIDEDNTVFVGSPKSSIADSSSGAVFIYEYLGKSWEIVQTLTAPDASTHDQYGFSIDAWNDRLVVGSPGAISHDSIATGRAYLYQRFGSEWLPARIFEPLNNDYTGNMMFGASVAIESAAVLVGAHRADTENGISVGKTYAWLSDATNFSEQVVIHHPVPQEFSMFGGGLALNAKHMIIGAHLQDNTHEDVGQAWIYDTSTLQPVSIEDPATIELPESFSLAQNYPNPFNPSTTIAFSLPVSQQVTITLFDMLGRRVGVLFDGVKEAGFHELRIDASNWASGVYTYRMETAGYSNSYTMTLMK